MIGEVRTLWLPLSKSADGKYSATLSDGSVDLDDEIISKELLTEWKDVIIDYLPGLMDHDNKVMNLLCQWVNPTLMKAAAEDSYALNVEPKWFLSNPNAVIVKDMIDKDGAKLGLSIGAKPSKFKTIKRDGKKIRVWMKAKLLEGSFTPIPANRNAYIMAKSYRPITKEALGTNTYETEVTDQYIDQPDDEERTKGAKLDRCVRALMADPKFKPQKGRTKEQSAYAVCNARLGGKSHSLSNENNMEELEMNEEDLNKKFAEMNDVMKANAEANAKLIKSQTEQIAALKKQVEESNPDNGDPAPADPAPADPAPAEPAPASPEDKSTKRREMLKHLASSGTNDGQKATPGEQLKTKNEYNLFDMLALSRGRPELVKMMN